MPVSLMEENGGGYLYRVQLLRTFGAAGAEETGYLVVPDGAGALIRFNNGKTSAAAYSQYIYDIDRLEATYTMLENTTPARLPLYGICRENSSVLATVERGASLCYLTADVAGKYNSYNDRYPSFMCAATIFCRCSGSRARRPICRSWKKTSTTRTSPCATRC